jgi:prepilin-type N-terminal cleavage/methylation domain-containing protein
MKLNNQKGFTLIEVIVSIALLAIVGVGLLSALVTTSRSLITTDERETAKNIAEMQMEYLKSLPFSNAYTPRDITTDYPGFSISTDESGFIQAQAVPSRTDGNIQKLSITVNHGPKTILTITGYKVR